MPQPFSIRHYFLRHKRKSLALMAGLILSMLVIAFVAGMISSVDENVRLAQSFISRFSVVDALTPEGIPEEKVEAMRSHPDVTAVYPVSQLTIQAPLLVGTTSVLLFTLDAGDLAEFAGDLNVTVLEGRLPAAAGEIAVSRQMAVGKGWQVGDVVGSEVNEGQSPRGRFEVVGLLGDDPYIALATTYREGDGVPGYAVFARPDRRAEVDAWLESAIAVENKIGALTKRSLDETLQDEMGAFSLILALLTAIVTITNTVVTTLLAYIFISQRRPEFALYLALGQPLGRVILRALTETSAVLFLGWAFGMACTTGLFWWVKQSFFDPRGLAFTVFNPTIVLHTLPSPVMITLVLAIVLTLMLSRLDYISVIEGRN